MREIVTLHIGNYANYVGAHFWNLQDEASGCANHECWGPAAAAIDYRCLYAEGFDERGRLTWKPRALFVDAAGSLGGVRPVQVDSSSTQHAQQQEDTISTWSGGMVKHQAPAVRKSAFVQYLEEDAVLNEENDYDEDDEALAARQAQLSQAASALSGATARLAGGAAAVDNATGPAADAGVRYWTDYLKVQLHPKSVYTLPGVWHDVTDFTGYGDGLDAMKTSNDVRDEVSERIRVMVEDCDGLQGFQVFTEDISGWGGVTQCIMEEVHEEYCQGGRPSFIFSLRPPRLAQASTSAKARHKFNEALAMSWVQELSHIYTPLCLPASSAAAKSSLAASLKQALYGKMGRTTDGLSQLSWNAELAFETSAVLAAAIDTAMMPVRFADSNASNGQCCGGVNMHSLANLLRGQQRSCPLAAMAVALPLPCLKEASQQLQSTRDPRTGSSGTAAGGAATSASGAQTSAHTSSHGERSSTSEGADEDLQDLHYLASVTPGVRSTTDDDLAEALTVRGGRVSGQWTAGAASCSAVNAALAHITRPSTGLHMCVRHRAVSRLPMLVPLPFPKLLWSSRIGPDGQIGYVQPAAGLASLNAHNKATGTDASRASTAAASGSSPSSDGQRTWDVETSPMAAKMFASTQFESYVEQVRQGWRQAAGSVSGQAVLSQWNMDSGVVDHVCDALHGLASSYSNSDDELDDL